VLGFEIDRNDVMWILDQGQVTGAPSGTGDEKLIGWNLKTGKEVARYEFSDADSDKKCSFLNDVAVDNDSGLVYISDSGIFCNPLKGGILVSDIKANKAKRVLSAPEWVNDENFALSSARKGFSLFVICIDNLCEIKLRLWNDQSYTRV
jgi:sugar lactone lactonase YvrE